MRLLAMSQGMKLNEYGLYDQKGKFIPVNSEEEIFEKIGMNYVYPQDR